MLLLRIEKIETQGKKVTIALVGKYTKCKDSYLSVHESLTHAAWLCRRKLVVKVRKHHFIGFTIILMCFFMLTKFI